MSSLLRRVGGLLFTLFLFSPLAAVADPPARVGRLAHLEDVVEFRLQRDDVAAPATRNWPISSGAVLSTGERGRAEVWVDSTAFRLGDNTQVEFSSIDDERVVLDVAGGSLAISIMDAEQAADLQLRLPDGRVRFAAPGRYRLDVWPERSELTTLAGLATLEHDGGRIQLAAGNSATLFADGELRIDGSGRPDAFDRWVAERENATLASVSRRHVSPYMTGYQDLDAYGDWQAHQDYGSVWYPRVVASDWAPYRFGRWAWIAPWGWTWIDAAPWGFAPFHYGRWVVLHGRWAWVPGRRLERPVYAPALVAWIGNPGWSVSFSFGAAPAVGWFPLAPREVYVPHYRHSPTYVRRLNVTHVHNVTVIDRAVRVGRHEHFVHRGSPQAVTVVPANRLREGREINAREYRRIDRHDLGRAPVAVTGAGRDWLAPAPEARRPRQDDRRERWSDDGRPERRSQPDFRSPAPAHREPPALRPDAQGEPAPAVAPAVRDVRREPREERRNVREVGRDDGAPAIRNAEPVSRPAAMPLVVPEHAAPAVGREPRRDPGDERGNRREAVRDDTVPVLRRPEAAPRPSHLAVPAPERVAPPERDPRRELRELQRNSRDLLRDEAPPRELRREPRELMRSPMDVRQDESRAPRRAEPEAPRPAMRVAKPPREQPREARGGRERDAGERRGRADERGGERGERGPR